MNNEEQREFLLSTFREEIEGHVITLTRGLVDLEESDETEYQLEIMRELMRALHTIKGAARMMGFGDITRIAHAMEDLIGFYRGGKHGNIPGGQIDMLFQGIDTISELTRLVTHRGQDGPGTPSTELSQPEQINMLVEQFKVLAGVEEAETHAPQALTVAPEELIVAETLPYEPEVVGTGITVFNTPETDQPGTRLTSSRSDGRAEETIRVRLDKLDSMINLAGELVINKLQNEEHLNNLQTLLTKSRQRSKILLQLRDFVVDQIPLEERSRLLGITELFSFGDEDLKAAKEQFLQYRHGQNGNNGGTATVAPTRSHNIANDMVLDGRSIRKVYDKLEQLVEIDREVEELMSDILRERKRYNLNFETTSDELRRNMLGIRMLPLDTLFSRYTRLVRDLAIERGKQVKLVITGGAVEIDKRILEEIADPLQHMLRNAVDHGVEKPQERMAKGKSAEGIVTLSASQRGNHVHIKVSDDGEGLDPDKLLHTAITRGFISQEEARLYSEENAYDLIFRPGFSTRHSVDEVSGRGVGLDVVQQNIKRLSGRVSLISDKNKGTSFTMEIPLTLATIDVLLVQVSGQLFAIPSTMVETTLHIAKTDIVSVEGKEAIHLRDQLVPLVHLDRLLALPPLEAENENRVEDTHFSGVLLSASMGGSTGQEWGMERFLCFVVEKLVDEREVVVKGLGKFMEHVPNVGGATLLGADGLALILDVFGLVQTARSGGVPNAPVGIIPEAVKSVAPQRASRILVVDDSLATRELERSILETAGFDVETARDGVEALQICQRKVFDLVMTDVEMPNMDGFRLTAALQQDDNLRHIPVIIVSSRDSEVDKRKGLQVGAKAYIVKGQFEQNKLLETISRMIV